MDPCRTGIDLLSLVISLFSESVDCGRRQHFIDTIENGPLGSERGVMFHHFQPLWVRHCDLVRQPFPLHPTKGPRAFLILKRSSQVSKGYTLTECACRPARTHICRDPHDGDGHFGWRRIHNKRTLKANESLFRLSEDSLKIISDI